MAKITENEKGFLVLKVSGEECRLYFQGEGICDYCNKSSQNGYYIAVLNCWYCPECYGNFTQRAKRCSPDTKTEEKNFLRACILLGLK